MAEDTTFNNSITSNARSPFLAEVVATLLEFSAATFDSDAPELFSQQFAILCQKNNIRDIYDVAASLISSSELSLITIAVDFSVTHEYWTDKTCIQKSKVLLK